MAHARKLSGLRPRSVTLNAEVTTDLARGVVANKATIVTRSLAGRYIGELIMPHSPGATLFDHLREIGRELVRALRVAAKRLTFSLVAIATLGIGIGAPT